MQLKVKDIKAHTQNIISLIFEKPKNFIFYPGQFLDIELPVKDPKGVTRIFSLSSSPSEDFLMLTYKTGTSPFKKKFQNLKMGDLISSSYPAGTIVIDNSSPLVLMPGGIGIAPHRSMIKWAVDRKLNLPITLIYSNSDSDFIFKNELDAWQKQLPSLKIVYHNTSQKGHLNPTQLVTIVEGYVESEAIFYLAGPPSMVDDFEGILLNLGVNETSIRTDRFDGL